MGRGDNGDRGVMVGSSRVCWQL